MKTPITSLALVFTFASISQAKILVCESYDNVDGWNGAPTHEHAILSAGIESDGTLVNAQINGAFVASAETSVADAQYTSKNPRYSEYTQYSALEDAWCWYTPFLPKQLANATETMFTGFFSRTCEGGGYNNGIAMKCVIK